MAGVKPKIKAWDIVQDDVAFITKVGYTTPLSKHEERLQELLDKFYQANIPIAMIHDLGEVIKESYWIGKEDVSQD
jgi:hypothetical protein